MFRILQFALALTSLLQFIERAEPFHSTPPRKLFRYRWKVNRSNRFENLNRFYVDRLLSQMSQIYSSPVLSLFESIGVPYPASLSRKDLVSLLLAQICITFLRSAYTESRNQTIEGLWIEEFTNSIDLYYAISSAESPSLELKFSANDDSMNSTTVVLSKSAINTILQSMLSIQRDSITLFKESPIAAGNSLDKYQLTIFPGSYVNSVVAYTLKSFEGKHL